MTTTALSLFGTENFSYLFLGSALAVCGLVNNSKDVLIGSMLVSPLFLPIINMHAARGGEVVNNAAILAASVAFCIGSGYVASRVLKLENDTPLMEDISSWEEGGKTSTIIHYVVPVLAGAIIAIANRSQNIIPMVGVGVAFAILPPLVSAGLYWGKSVKTKAWQSEKTKAWQSLKLAVLNIVMGTVSFSLTTNVLV